MAEQLEIVIGANVDDAKAGVKDLQGVINDFARQGKLSIGVVEQSLAQLRAQIKVTSNPDDVAKLKQAYTELNKTLQQLKISGGLESQLNGISRSTRLAHSDLDQMSRSLAEVASGNGNVIESLSRVAFSFEQLRGQAGSTKGALAELGDVLKSPTGLLVAGAALVPLLIDMGSKFLDIASGSRQAEEDLKTLTAQLKISQEAIKGFNEDIDQAAVTRRLRIDIETPPGIGRTIKELGADLDAAQLKILNTLPAIKSYREELDRVEASSKKVAEAQKDLHVGSLAFEQNKVTLENNARQIELLKKQIQEANKELEKAQQDVINIPLKIQLTNLDEARAEGKKQLQEFNRNLIERAKADAPFFEVPVNLKFVVGDTSERELEKAKDILSGIEEHTIRLKIVVPDAIELPKLKPEVDQPFFKQQLNDLIKGFDIPIRAALDEPSLAQTEDAIKKIFSGFSDTNIFTQFGHSAGEKFRTALLESLKEFNKGFIINPQIDVTDIINSLTSSLSGIKDIQLKVIKTETFDNAIRTLRDLHDAGIEAGDAVEKAMLNAGRSAEDAAKAGKAVKDIYKGISKETADLAQALDQTLTPAFQNLFDAILKGKDPLKAFFASIAQSLEELASKLIGTALEKQILSLLGITSQVSAAITATTAATTAAGVAGTAAAATAAAAAAGATAAAASASAAAAAAIIAAAAAKAASASINPLALLGLLGLGFAEGGEPPVGKPSIVGEKGWELFVPKVPGVIYSHADSMKLVNNSVSSSSVKDSETIREYLIATRVSQQVKEYFNTSFTERIKEGIRLSLIPIETKISDSVRSMTTNNDKLTAYTYKLHDQSSHTIEKVASLTDRTKEASFEKISDSIKSLKESFRDNKNISFEKIVASSKESSSIADYVKHYSADKNELITRDSVTTFKSLILSFKESLSQSSISSSSSSLKERLLSEFISTTDKDHLIKTASIESLKSIVSLFQESFTEIISDKQVSDITSYKDSIASITNIIPYGKPDIDKSSHYEKFFDRLDKVIVNNLTSTGTASNKFTDHFLTDRLTSSFKQLQSTSTKAIERLHESFVNNNVSASISKLHEKITDNKSVTIERIINNNFFSSNVKDTFASQFKSMSITDLQKTFHIPAFAQGGAVFGPTLAILGEGFGISRGNPEFVGTRGQLSGIQGGQFDVNVNVDGELSFSMGKLVAEINREVRSQIRTSGKNPLG